MLSLWVATRLLSAYWKPADVISVSVIKEELRLLGPNADVKASCGNTIFGQKEKMEEKNGGHQLKISDDLKKKDRVSQTSIKMHPSKPLPLINLKYE